MIAAYALPAVAVWSALGFAVTVVRLGWLALAAAVVYGGCYAATEISGRGLPPPGRSWQVPQTMLIEASARRRVLVWGAVLGPGFATRNPYAGFWLLPLAVASMPGTGAGLAAGAAVGLAHGAARAAALLRDVHDVHDLRALAVASDPGRGPGSEGVPVAAGQASVPGGAAPDALITHLDVLLKTVYWRRLDGALLLAAAAMALAAWPGSVT